MEGPAPSSFANEDLSYYNDLINLLKSSLLPEQTLDSDQSNLGNNVGENATKSQNNLLAAMSMFSNIDRSLNIPKKFVIYAVIFCGEHSKLEFWTNALSVRYAKKLLKEVLERCVPHSHDFSSLLQLYKLDSFLTELRPKILKNSWKKYPAAVLCFTWLLFNIECPHLEDHLNNLLPTCLLLVDDHLRSNKILGLQCLQHVANNVSRSALNQYGRGTVIYIAIEHMIYVREAEIIAPLTSCLIALLSKTEYISKNSLTWSHFDDVLNIWLPSMEIEQKLILREAYIDNLNGLLQVMGLASVQWSNKLLAIIAEYCENESTCVKSLMCLLTFINATWPRTSSSFPSIVTILMKITITIAEKEVNSTDFFTPTLMLVKQCFKSLETLSDTEYKAFWTEIKKYPVMNNSYLLLSENL